LKRFQAGTERQIMTTSSFTFTRVAALVLAGLAGIAQANPLPPHYHVMDVTADMHDIRLESINASGVAAGTQNENQAVVLQDGVFHTLGCGNDESPHSIARSINDTMQVAGECVYPDGKYKATVWDAAGNPSVIRGNNGPSDYADTALGINNPGQVTGSKGGVAYVWTPGKLKLLGTLDGGSSIGSAINDRHWIVGYSRSGATRAFLYRHGRMEDLNWPGSSGTAYAVNAPGHIVGWAGDSVFTAHGFLDDGVTLTDLGPHTFPNGINRSDQVVGDRNGHGFIYTHRRVYDLNSLLDSTSDPGWVIQSAEAINDSGVIVGWGIRNGSYYPVMLTPVP